MNKPDARRTADSEPAVQPQPWPAAWTAALSDASLLLASSAAIVQRAKGYAAAGMVEPLDEDPMPEPALRAQVTGTQVYATEVWIEDDAVAGSCDCPHARDDWFCKHQVAVALVWRGRLAADAAPPADAAAPRPPAPGGAERARTAQDKRQALTDFLHRQDAAALADKLLAWADRDRDIHRELQQWRKAGAAGSDQAELKSLVNEMLAPGRSFVAWNETASVLWRAEAVLPLLQQARSRDAAAAATLCLHALRRAWRVLEQADDSDGDIGNLCRAIGDEWVLSLQAAGPQKAGFGDTYLAVQLEDPVDSFDAAAADAAIGEPALAHYRRALAARWRQAKDAVLASKAAQAAAGNAGRNRRAAVADGGSVRELNLWTLERLHLLQLQASGEVDAALAVLREDLSEPHAHSAVVAYLEQHGRFREAFAQAEQGCKAFADDVRLQGDLLRCYERDGWTAEALALRRRQFEQHPDVERYRLVLKAGLAAGQDVPALKQSLIDFLAAQETQAMGRQRQSAQRFGMAGDAVAPAVRDVTLRAQVLGADGRWDAACALVQPPAVCSEPVLCQIARQLPPQQQEQAQALLLRVFGSVMRRASSPYRDALALVDDILRRMDAPRRAAWLAQLRSEFKAKRNFVRDLPRG